MIKFNLKLGKRSTLWKNCL